MIWCEVRLESRSRRLSGVKAISKQERATFDWLRGEERFEQVGCREKGDLR